MKDLEIGGIYITEWDERPFRVIGLDEIQVFYDCLWPHDNSWTFSGNFKKKCSFYRTSSLLFAEKSKMKDFLPLNEEECKVFRPDLIMRLGRIKELKWNQIDFSDYEDFLKYFDSTFTSKKDEKIETDAIVLLPYGPKGGLKKGEKIIADNNKFFTSAELIWKAKKLQEVVNNGISNGIGIHRTGFEKGLPSYYIGEYIDMAGLIKE